MPRKKTRARKPETHDNVDHTVASLALARLHAAQAIEVIDEAMRHFEDPGEDEDGEERSSLLEAVDEALGEASRSVQEAQRCFEEHEADDVVTREEVEDEDEDDEEDE